MFGRNLLTLALLTSCAPAASEPPSVPADQAAWAAQCKDWDEWDKAAPPFKVFGNTWYVGTCGISAILIDTPQGAVVIDGGPENAGKLVARNIEQTGHKLTSVSLLLNSHEHHDHVGGLAELQKLTGAFLITSKAAMPVLESGIAGKDDPQFAGGAAFPKVGHVGATGDGDPVTIGNFVMTGHTTPGHTPGAMTWQWKSCEGTACKTIVYADSLTPVSSDSYRFSDHPAYLAAFRASIAKIAALDCDILLTPHPSASGMRDKLLKADLAGTPRCKEYADGLGRQLDERLAEEAKQ